MARGWNEGAVFTQAQIDCMRVALARACTALAFAFPTGTVDKPTLELLASAILESAAEGETSPLRLCAVALRNLPPLEAVNARNLSFGNSPFFLNGPIHAEDADSANPARLGEVRLLATA
jgi:hypothetical protein